MFLIRWALQNSFVVLAITLGLVFLGAAVVPGIPTDVLPDFKTPVVVSFFSYPGLPTLDMEKSVTSRVERALTLAGKLDKQESRTLPGAAVLKITFQPGTDASSAMNDIVNLEASDMFHLPPGIEHPLPCEVNRPIFQWFLLQYQAKVLMKQCSIKLVTMPYGTKWVV